LGHEIIINKTGRETRVVVIEHGQLAEMHIDRGNNHGFVGNVYLGKVVRVLPGMQAAFVDIGLDKAAFLYAGDIYPEFLEQNGGSPEISNDITVVEGSSRSRPKHGIPPIQDLVHEGQELLVQVAKDPISTKGARIKTHITLPGRFTVCMPTVDHIGISKKIDRDKERRKLRDFVNKNRPAGCGFIIRTVSLGQPLEAIEQDMNYLINIWNKIQEKRKTASGATLIHEDHILALRVVRDSFTDNVDRLMVDDKQIYQEIIQFTDIFAPQLKSRVRLYNAQEPIFDAFNVEPMIARTLERRVNLKSGGYLIIDQTEALTAIDVNSGKFVGTKSLEDTTLLINLEAVAEICNQLRLRNIGGIIVLDFIDMERAHNRERIYRFMEEQLRLDRARTNLLKISDLGLIEMTRKRVQEDLVSSISQTCPYCKGTGAVRSPETVVHDILREVRRVGYREKRKEYIYVNAHPEVADLLYSREMNHIEVIESNLGKKVVVRALGHYHIEKYEVYSH
jgi:ribonuclease G